MRPPDIDAGLPDSTDLTLKAAKDRLIDLMRVVEEADVRISSVMTLETSGQREVVLRVTTLDPTAAIEALCAAGHTVRGSRPRETTPS